VDCVIYLFPTGMQHSFCIQSQALDAVKTLKSQKAPRSRQSWRKKARMAAPKFGQKWFLFLFKSQLLNFSTNKYAYEDGSAKKQN